MCRLFSVVAICLGFSAPSWAETVAYYRFEEGFPDEAIDDETGDPHGLIEGVAQSGDVPLADINGVPNNFSASFGDNSSIRFDGATFILHDEAAGGSNEATLEFYIKPEEQGHNVIFWTIDGGGDANRYNISINNGGAINVDYRQENGTILNLPPIPAIVDLWTHIAITRTEDGAGGHDYEYFVDGVSVGFGNDPAPVLPTAFTWTISGRQGCCSKGKYLLDEIRFSDEALDPDDMLPPADPPPAEICDNGDDDDGDGDVDCDDLQCVAICNPEICDDGEDNDQNGTTDCEDLACITDPACTLDASESWYRFEEGEGFDIIESVTDEIAGITDAVWSTDVPLETVNGEANELSMEFSGGTSVRIGVGYPFILHSPTVGGAGDATLQWYMKPRDQGHNGLFWTQDGGGDANRYNIHMQSAGLGADFREEGGTLHGVMAGQVTMPLDVWSHLAVVRTDLGDGTHNYDWYLEGLFNNAQIASAQVPVAETWTISGRGGCCNAYEGWLDEVHMVPEALEPGDFFDPVEEVIIDEICDNEIDDDEDGSTDCEDSECTNELACNEIIDSAQTYYRFEEGSEDCAGLPCDVVDEATGDSHGVAEWVVYSDNVPLETVDGNTNEFSLQFPEADAAVRFDAAPFVFHSPIAGGSFEATLEFYINAAEQGHNAFFWTVNGGGDANRYNISINAGGSIQADYREESGVIHTGIGGADIPTGTWVHVAAVRADLGDGSHEYNWYVEHELASTGFDLEPNLPTATTWTMSGRGGCCNAFNGFIDELRMTPEALDPGDFLDAVSGTKEVVCDDFDDNDGDGDVDCDDADCAGAPACQEQCNDQDDNDGDGDVDCDDTDCAGDPLCGCDPNPFPQTYYRFEGDLADDVSGDVHGDTDAAYSDDVPAAEILGQPNETSLSFSGGSAARFNGSTFILHSGCEATLEFFIKPADQGHVGVFWTQDGGGDANRYNIHFQGPGLGADYREEGGNLHAVLNGSFALPFDEWSHVACVRTNAVDGAGHQYDWYVDGELVDTAFDEIPLPPTADTWTISGRGGCCNQFEGLLDEVRMTPSALSPDEFMTADGGGCVPVQEDCANGVDDDCDGNVDDADEDCAPSGVGPFIRGDCDGNTQVGGSPTEAIVLLNFAFRGGNAPPCLAACDAEANGSIGITDALRILRHAFLGVGEPDAPFPDCTTSDIGTDVDLGCETPIACP